MYIQLYVQLFSLLNSSRVFRFIAADDVAVIATASERPSCRHHAPIVSMAY